MAPTSGVLAGSNCEGRLAPTPACRWLACVYTYALVNDMLLVMAYCTLRLVLSVFGVLKLNCRPDRPMPFALTAKGEKDTQLRPVSMVALPPGPAVPQEPFELAPDEKGAESEPLFVRLYENEKG